METADNHAKKVRIEIGGKLRQLRQDAGMSQQKLAELTGMKQPMINRFETGERAIYVDHAKKFAPVFGIAPAELLPPDIDVPARHVAGCTAQGGAVPTMSLHDLIEDRARKDGAYAVAFALLKLADVLGQVAERSADSGR
jgi:transcriptional regulator with XRE-family HTH domain